MLLSVKLLEMYSIIYKSLYNSLAVNESHIYYHFSLIQGVFPLFKPDGQHLLEFTAILL